MADTPHPTPLAQSDSSDVPAAVSVRPIKAGITEFTAELPCGIVHGGAVLRSVVLRTVTAGDRRIFGEEKMLRNPPKLVTKLLHSKIVKIPGLKNVTEQTVRNLLGIDRDALVLALRNETARTRPFEVAYKCKHCGGKNESTVPASLVTDTLKVMPDEVRLRLDGGMTAFDVPVPEFGFKGRFFYPDGATQEYLTDRAGGEDANPFELQLELLARLCLDFNGEGARPNAEDWAEFDVAFIDALEEAIRKHEFGYNFAAECRCYRCKETSRVRVDALDFLFEGLKRRMSET